MMSSMMRKHKDGVHQFFAFGTTRVTLHGINLLGAIHSLGRLTPSLRSIAPCLAVLPAAMTPALALIALTALLAPSLAAAARGPGAWNTPAGSIGAAAAAARRAGGADANVAVVDPRVSLDLYVMSMWWVPGVSSAATASRMEWHPYLVAGSVPRGRRAGYAPETQPAC